MRYDLETPSGQPCGTLAPFWPNFARYLSPFRYLSALIDDAERWPN